MRSPRRPRATSRGWSYNQGRRSRHKKCVSTAPGEEARVPTALSISALTSNGDHKQGLPNAATCWALQLFVQALARWLLGRSGRLSLVQEASGHCHRSWFSATTALWSRSGWVGHHFGCSFHVACAKACFRQNMVVGARHELQFLALEQPVKQARQQDAGGKYLCLGLKTTQSTTVRHRHLEICCWHCLRQVKYR